MADGYVMRRMERSELDFAVGMAAGEGWNPGLKDAEAFWAADPEGFHIGLLDGRPAATLSGVRYADNGRPAFDFIGLYIVVPGLRGRGYGMRLWNHVLEGLKAPTIALDSVVAQLDTYRKDGFEVSRHSSRYEGRFGGGAMEVAPGVRPLAEFPFAEVLAYDRRCFPAPREAFLRAWITLPGHVALGLERGGGLAGFGVIRPCGVGSKIGPLFAEDDAAALALFRALCANAPGSLGKGQPVFYDVPMNHAGAVRLAESHNMRPVFETGRMYRGPVPEIDLGREYGVTSFELG